MSDRPINLLLIDDDPIFRLGLATALSSYPQWEVAAQLDTLTDALTYLSNHTIDLVILDPNVFNQGIEPLDFCQQVNENYPETKICLLSNFSSNQALQVFQDLGVEGYCQKGVPIEELVNCLRQIIQNERVWPSLSLSADNQISSRKIREQTQPWLYRLQTSGMAQIEADLNSIDENLKQISLSKLDKIFWQGRKRELLAARWLIKQILPVNVIFIDSETRPINSLRQINQPNPSFMAALIQESDNNLKIFNHTLDKLQGNLKNLTKIPLEIDILKPDIKQEILLIILNQLHRIVNDLKFLDPDAQQLANNIPIILQKLWRESALGFLGKECIEKQNFRFEDIDILIQDYEILVEKEILAKIPFVTELFNYLLFETHLMIDQVFYRPDSPEALERAEKFLQNLIIQVANGIVSLILNNFSGVEPIKQKLYNMGMASSREIAKFRNRLAWEYRQTEYWEEPRNIFESQYRIFFLTEKGLESAFIYAPRQTELKNLTGLRWGVTILLEIRDAVSPLLRSIVAFVGNGLVYILTQVIGRGLGLVGRGIIQGIGNSLQEAPHNKRRSERD